MTCHPMAWAGKAKKGEITGAYASAIETVSKK
jgi:hypothetical protein